MTDSSEDRGQLPAPLVPAEVDLRDFAFTPMYRARLFGSAFHARATDAEWRAGVSLWLKCQDQSPAGSLPDDDIELCRLAELGRDLKAWKKIRSGALHGWFKCADGRLYNKVTAEIALEQWQGKLDQRQRTLKARIAKLDKLLLSTTDDAVKTDLTEQLQRLRQSLSQVTTPPVTRSVTEPVTTSKGQREREGQGEGQGYCLLPPQASANGHGASDDLDIPPSFDKRRASRIADDWSLTPELRTIAEEARAKAKLPPVNIELEAEKFCDFWRAKSGKDATKTDWLATWRNWIRNARAPFGAAAPATTSTGKTAADYDREFADMRRRGDA